MSLNAAERIDYDALTQSLGLSIDPALLAAVNWADSNERARPAVLVVGHQPTLGQTAALLLSGTEANWTIKKGALWWFSNRTWREDTQTILRAVVPPTSGK